MNGRARLMLLLALAGASVAGLGLAQNAPAPAATPAAPAPAPTVITIPTPGAAPAQVAAPPDEAPIPAQPKPSQQAVTELPPPAPKAPAEPLKRPRYAAAVLQGVDKITAETLRFETKVGEPVRYKSLIVTVHACEGTATDEGMTDAMAHLEVQSRPEGVAAARTVYRGWMYASSPSLHPVEHSVYDLWLIACKTAAPAA